MSTSHGSLWAGSRSALRERAFDLYSRWFRRKLSVLFTGKLRARDLELEVRRLDARSREDVNSLLEQQVDDDDRTVAGIESRRFNFAHSCFVYFGIYNGSELAALWWLKIVRRNTVEPSMIIAKKWRGRGLLSSLHHRNEAIYRRQRISHRYRVNRNNPVMVDFYRKQGVAVDHVEGHLCVYEIRY